MSLLRAGAHGVVALAGLSLLLGIASRAEELVAYTRVGNAIPQSLTGQPGNPERGWQTMRDLDNVTCLICHSVPIGNEPDQGAIGPPLAGVGSRYSEGELRLRLVNPKAFNPDTIMPAYYRVEGLTRVLQQYRDKTIYTAQQIEDVVAYLVQLKGT
jgi:sulfur-oxidizing protein SoxX